MECLVCRDLERSYDAGLREYRDALSSAYYRVSKKLAAVKNVEMERARYELSEHCLLCAFAAKVHALTLKQDMSLRLGRPAAWCAPDG